MSEQLPEGFIFEDQYHVNNALDKTSDEVKPIASAIFNQESDSGKVDTSKPNNRGAGGPGQITKGTFNDWQKKGIISPELKWDNPADNAKAATELITHYHKIYNGDPHKIAAAYYSGSGAINSDGTIKDLKDPVNKNAPSTLQYASNIANQTLPEGFQYEDENKSQSSLPVGFSSEPITTEQADENRQKREDPTVGGPLETFVKRGANQMTLGLGPPLVATGAALGSVVKGWLPGSTDKRPWDQRLTQDYETVNKEYAAQLGDLANKNPKSAFVGDVAGSLAPISRISKLIPGVGNVSGPARIAINTGKNAVIGGTVGGISAANEALTTPSDDSWDKIKSGATWGSVLGGGLGFIGGAFAAGAKRFSAPNLLKEIDNKIDTFMGPEKEYAKKIIGSVEEPNKIADKDFTKIMKNLPDAPNGQTAEQWLKTNITEPTIVQQMWEGAKGAGVTWKDFTDKIIQYGGAAVGADMAHSLANDLAASPSTGAFKVLAGLVASRVATNVVKGATQRSSAAATVNRIFPNAQSTTAGFKRIEPTMDNLNQGLPQLSGLASQKPGFKSEQVIMDLFKKQGITNPEYTEILSDVAKPKPKINYKDYFGK